MPEQPPRASTWLRMAQYMLAAFLIGLSAVLVGHLARVSPAEYVDELSHDCEFVTNRAGCPKE